MTDGADGAELARLRAELAEFVAERNWAQYHTAKNLVMALSAEVGELTEHFMWLDADAGDSPDAATAAAVADEIGDVLIYLLHLADRLGIDPVAAARHKLAAAREKYPADRYRVPDGAAPTLRRPGGPAGAEGAP